MVEYCLQQQCRSIYVGDALRRERKETKRNDIIRCRCQRYHTANDYKWLDRYTCADQKNKFCDRSATAIRSIRFGTRRCRHEFLDRLFCRTTM